MTTAMEKADQYLRDRYVYRYNGQLWKATRGPITWELSRAMDQTGRHPQTWPEGTVDFYSLHEDFDHWFEFRLGRREIGEEACYAIPVGHLDLNEFEHIGPALEPKEIRLFLDEAIYQIGDKKYKGYHTPFELPKLLLIDQDGEILASVDAGELWGYGMQRTSRNFGDVHWYQLISDGEGNFHFGALAEDEVMSAERLFETSEEFRMKKQFAVLMDQMDW